MSKVRQLSNIEAKRTLVARLGPTVSRLRQRLTDAGLRPYNVNLVWTRWDGEERGEGDQLLLRRLPVLPTPEVTDLTGVALQSFAAGLIPVGSVRVQRIAPTYAQDLLMGLVMPCDPAAALDALLAGNRDFNPTREALRMKSVPDTYKFFWEIQEDGRANDGRPAVRARFRPMSNPFRRAGQFDWVVVLERQSEDMERDGEPGEAAGG